MVDFTKPVSNEHMVDGLKRLLHSNETMIAKCESAKLASTDQDTLQTLNQLTDMYEQHIAMLTDSLHFLGGSTSNTSYRQSKRRSSPSSSGADNSLLIEIEDEEQCLRKSYLDELKRLKASDEAVNVINKALLDAQDVKALLHKTRRCQRARS